MRAKRKAHSPALRGTSATPVWQLDSVSPADLNRICTEEGLEVVGSIELAARRSNAAFNSFRVGRTMYWSSPPNECRSWAKSAEQASQRLLEAFGASTASPFISREKLDILRDAFEFDADVRGENDDASKYDFEGAINRALAAVTSLQSAAARAEAVFAKRRRKGSANRDALALLICQVSAVYWALTGKEITLTLRGPAIRFVSRVLRLFAHTQGTLGLTGTFAPRNAPPDFKLVRGDDANRLAEELRQVTPHTIQYALRSAIRQDPADLLPLG